MSKEMKLIPKLRFPEFEDDGEWVEDTLDNLAAFSKGKGISKSDIVENGKTPCIRYGELYTQYNETIGEVVSYTNLDPSDLVLSDANDVIIPASGETQIDIATASCVLKAGIALGGDLNIIKADINGVFLAYYFNSAKKKEIAQVAQGISVVHLYSSQLKTLTVNIPSPQEQQKIASCLSSLDELIAAHKDKLAALKDHKKGLLQNLFPQEGETVPKVRFAEFEGDGEWVEKKFEELFTIGSGKDYKHLSEGEIPVYGSGGYMLSVDDFLYDGESVCIGRKGTIDNPIFLTGKFWTVDTLFYTHQFNDCLPKFIYYVFLGINWQNHNEAGGVPSLSKKNLYQITTTVPPTTEEQQKIASCLSAVDELITARQEKIEELQQHKKGLMQGLFPKMV